MAYTPSNQTIRLAADYMRATATVQFTSSAKMKVEYKDGKSYEGTFDAWKADPAERKKFFMLKSITVGRKSKKVQAFLTPANDSEAVWLVNQVDGLERKCPVGMSQMVGRDDVVAFNKLFTGVFPGSESFKLGLVDRDDSKKEPVETNVPGN